mmetsp:Transcript_39131/g.123329  ORF Transcript_39131/g.123329 Transcript_39131/m.123329 type:complete len:344 (-) Transcript_39131:96-1127(-)
MTVRRTVASPSVPTSVTVPSRPLKGPELTSTRAPIASEGGASSLSPPAPEARAASFVRVRMDWNWSSVSGRGQTKPREPSSCPERDLPPWSAPTKLTTYCIPVMKVCSARVIRMWTRMYEGITDASRTEVSPSAIGTKIRSMSSCSRCTSIAWERERSTVRSKPLAVCSMYHRGSTSRCTSVSMGGRPAAILRRVCSSRSTSSALRPVTLSPSTRSSVLRSATVMFATVGSSARAFCMLASRCAATVAASSSSSSSSMSPSRSQGGRLLSPALPQVGFSHSSFPTKPARSSLRTAARSTTHAAASAVFGGSCTGSSFASWLPIAPKEASVSTQRKSRRAKTQR